MSHFKNNSTFWIWWHIKTDVSPCVTLCCWNSCSVWFSVVLLKYAALSSVALKPVHSFLHRWPLQMCQLLIPQALMRLHTISDEGWVLVTKQSLPQSILNEGWSREESRVSASCSHVWCVDAEWAVFQLKHMTDSHLEVTAAVLSFSLAHRDFSASFDAVFTLDQSSVFCSAAHYSDIVRLIVHVVSCRLVILFTWLLTCCQVTKWAVPLLDHLRLSFCCLTFCCCHQI